MLIFSHFLSPFYLKIYGWRNSFLSLQRLRGSLDQIMGLTYLKIGFYFLFIFVTERSTAPQMDERLVEVFKGYVTKEHVAVLLCGNLRRIHLHLTQMYATTNFLFNLVEQLFKVFFLSRWRIWGHCVINVKWYFKNQNLDIWKNLNIQIRRRFGWYYEAKFSKSKCCQSSFRIKSNEIIIKTRRVWITSN